MRISRLFIALIVFASPLFVSAASGLLDSTTTISSLNLLIAQYEARIKQLEAENNVLKNEMVKAGIKIPLTEYSGAIASPLPTTFPSTPLLTTTVSTGTVISTDTPTSSTGSSISTVSLSEITTKYGKDTSGFISRINTDWKAIKDFYKLPSLAKLAGYEFVSSGANDHVFVDIVVGTGVTGIYDMKILYQFERTEYKRKLVGIFQYNSETGRYVTLQGSNPFAGTVRTFVRDPYFVGTLSLPTTATPVIPGTSSVAPPTTNNISTTTTTTTATVGDVSLADITKAYSEKKYLSTITLSNTYLEKNKPTAEILNIRYRTFFIIGKYTESLAEVAKMEAMGALDRQTACNAQVIATYSKNTTLVTKYAAVCKK